MADKTIPAAVAASGLTYDVFEAPTTGADGKLIAGALKRSETIAGIYSAAAELGLEAVCTRLEAVAGAEAYAGEAFDVMGFALASIALERRNRA